MVWGIFSHARSLGTTQNCFIRAAALCPAKRRFAFFPMGSHARLAAEIPDVFLPLARNENSGMTMLFFSLGDCSGVGVCVDHGSGHSAPCRLRRDGTRRFWFGGFFHMLGAWERHRIVSSAPPRCVLRSGASHSFQWGVMPALRRRFRMFSFRLREMKIPE